MYQNCKKVYQYCKNVTNLIVCNKIDSQMEQKRRDIEYLALINYLKNAFAAEPAKLPAAPEKERTTLEPALAASDHFFQS